MLAAFAQGALLAAATPGNAVALPPPQVLAFAPAVAVPAGPGAPGAEPYDTPADPAASSAAPEAPTAPASPAPAAPAAPVRGTDDPLEGFNRAMFDAEQKADKAVIRPAAMAYKHGVPKLLRDAIRNILATLTEPIVFLNDLLQFRPVHALRTLSRFAINATMGWGGIFDVAKRPYFNLPHEPNGFADTLGYYGVGPGPYLFLPFVGPTTLRDLVGGGADGVILPFAVGKPFSRRAYQVPVAVIGGLDERAESDQDLQTLFATAVDPYATLRSVYLQDRAGEIAALHRHKQPIAKDPLGQDLTDPLSKPQPGANGAPQSQAPSQAPSRAPQLDDPLADPAAPAQSAAPTGEQTTVRR